MPWLYQTVFLDFSCEMKKKRLTTAHVLFAQSVYMLWGYFLIFPIQQRQDCQLPYTLYLENMAWHPCPGFHLSVIYYMSYTYDLSSYWYVTQMLSRLFLSLLHLTTDNWVWHMASYADQTVKWVQTGSSLSAAERCSTSNYCISLSQQSFSPLFKRLLHWLKEEYPSLCCAL